MRHGAWSADPELLWAASNDGVITVRELERLGVPQVTAYRRCRQGGPWQRLGPGIVALHNGTPTRRQRLIAALLHGGPYALLTGAAALRLHGMWRVPEPATAHLLIPHHHQVRSWGDFLVERTSRMPRGLERDGLAVAPLDRALLDEVRRLKDPVEIAARLAEPVQRGLVLPEALREELDAGCRKGSAEPRSVLHAVSDGIRSAAEFTVRDWWNAQPDFPKARFNVAVLDEIGGLRGIVDVVVEDVGFGMEVDSTEAHFATPEQIARDVVRRRGLREVGLHMMSVRPAQHRDDPDGTRRDVLDQLAVAAYLPPPRATFVDDLADAG